MAAQQRLQSVDELQASVSKTLESQLVILKEARKLHSHSDLLLPPDLASSALKPGSLHLKSLVDTFIQQSSEDERERTVTRLLVIGNIFAFEARKLVFEALKTEGKQELARTESKELFDRLDVILDLELYDLVENTLPLTINEEVLERLTITSCSQHFTYIELRVHELTKDLHPGKGKGLVLLRLCNDLIRRLSRPTRDHTVFVGRVLSLLSSVLPLGERSGVNFRGDFNLDNKTVWDGIAQEEAGDDAAKQATEDEAETSKKEDEESVGDVTAIKEVEERETGKADHSDEDLLKSVHDPAFYVLFWKMQAWFANPTLLFASQLDDSVTLPMGVADPILGGTDSMMKTFRISTRHVLNVFGAVGRREKELEGKADTGKPENESQARHLNGGTDLLEAGLQVDEASRKKRKLSSTNGEVEDDDKEEKDKDSFFPKYLTGRNLFEYELRDATFRRHLLAQYLILFQFLLSFAQSQKDKRKEWKNQAFANSNASFVLDEGDDRWIRDTWKEVMGLIKVTPEGRTFADSITQVLKREARWILWKSDSCPPIDRAPLSDSQLDSFAKARKSLSTRMRDYPQTVGTAALSRLWEDGVRKPEPMLRTMENEEGMEIQVQTDGLDELEFAPVIPSLESYASQIARLEAQQEKRRKNLEWEMPTVYPITTFIPPEKRQKEKERLARESKDKKMSDLEQMRILHAWRAARLARSSHLGSFAKMKMDEGKTTGLRLDDITRLMKVVEEKGRKSVLVSASLPQSASASVSAEGEGKREDDVEMTETPAVTSIDSEMVKAETSATTVEAKETPALQEDVTPIKQDEDTMMQS